MDHNNEIEKLKADCQELEEQVILLVSTELKLRRTQAELIQSKTKIEEYSRTLEQKVEERTKEIEEKNMKLVKQTHELNEINTLLEERQQQIEEQSTELASQNELLVENQIIIQKQSEILEKTNRQLIKEKKNLEKTLRQLKEVNVTKDKFFHIIAHDLKNPFSNIIGFSELLKKNFQKYDHNKLEAIINHISISSNTAYELLENLLVWAQSQRGVIEYNPEAFDLKALVIGNINFIEKQALKKQIEITTTINNEIPILADKNMLNTVMRNLLTNAIKFSHPHGKVTISAIMHPNDIEITVSDKGIGMSKRLINKLFRIDEHVTNMGTENERGTGLGLHLCKEFIEKHSGKIWVESKEGIGSEFKFTLPIRK